MTSLKDQMKLLKDAGKGAVEGIYKSITTGTNQLTKLEDMVSPETIKKGKKIVEKIKSGSKKIIKGDK